MAGENNSGKSSIMQPLLLMKQTLEAPYDPGALLLDGPNVQFTSGAQFITRKVLSSKAPANMNITLDTTSVLLRSKFNWSAESGIHLQSQSSTLKSLHECINLRFGMTSEEIHRLVFDTATS